MSIQSDLYFETYAKNKQKYLSLKERQNLHKMRGGDSLSDPALLGLPRKFLEYVFANNLQTSSQADAISRFKQNHNISLASSDIFALINGIFITIEKDGRHRGCIGTFSLINNDVIHTIIDRTWASAFSDPRFKKITKSELSNLTYKINYLEKPFSIDPSIQSIISNLKVGAHGITTIFSDGRRATYLASVLPEHFGVTQSNLGEKVEEIIESLKSKAGSIGSLSQVELYRCTEYSE